MKIKRQSKILEIIKNNEVETQEELATLLKDNEFLVTQATISRDIRELSLTKITTSNGKQKYSTIGKTNDDVSEKYYNILTEAITFIDYAQNLVIIKTLEGMAMAVAASLDGVDVKEIIGTIAGDDTLFCAVKSENEAIFVIEKINQIINKVT